MANYSQFDKLLHRLYLPNYFLSKASLEIEQSLFGNRAIKNKVDKLVFVSGLARSGTTSILRLLFATEKFASLRYSNMPFLLMPNLWRNKKNIPGNERAHNDGIKVSLESPEEFDEYFWKVMLKDKYILQNGLYTHNISDELLAEYIKYVNLICHSQNKNNYLTKNNNNILRVKSLQNIPNSYFIFLYRSPLEHAASLLKLHLQFSEQQKLDKFMLSYFNYLGHHEFGLNQKPFLLNTENKILNVAYPTSNINYWLDSWINYYNYLLKEMHPQIKVVSFEDLTSPKANAVVDFLNNTLNLNNAIPQIKQPHTPPKYSIQEYDKGLYNSAMDLYAALEKIKTY